MWILIPNISIMLLIQVVFQECQVHVVYDGQSLVATPSVYHWFYSLMSMHLEKKVWKWVLIFIHIITHRCVMKLGGPVRPYGGQHSYLAAASSHQGASPQPKVHGRPLKPFGCVSWLETTLKLLPCFKLYILHLPSRTIRKPNNVMQTRS